MGTQHHQRVAWLLALSSMTAARAAWAVPGEGETIRLAYHAPEQCPTRAELEVQLARAAPSLTVTSDDARGRRFVVEIDDSARRGRLTIESEGTAGTRDFEGVDCAEVIDQLALASALALQPVMLPRPPPTPAAPATSAPLAAARDSAAVSAGPRSNAWNQHEIALGVSSGVSNGARSGVYVSADVLYRRGPLVVGGVGDLGVGRLRYWGGGAAIGVTAPLPAWLRIDLLAVAGAHAYPVDRLGSEPRGPITVGVVSARANASLELAQLAVGLSATAESDLAPLSSTEAVHTRFVWGPFVGGTFGL